MIDICLVTPSIQDIPQSLPHSVAVARRLMPDRHHVRRQMSGNESENRLDAEIARRPRLPVEKDYSCHNCLPV
jgi:hypothetical protein